MASPAAVLSVLVTANTGPARARLQMFDRQMQKSTATAQRSTGAMAASIGRGAGRAAFAVGAIGGASLVAAAKFEDAFADVRKTVDATEPQFGRIEAGIRNMAKEIPVAATDLAHLAGEAGALGVKAKDIVKFTRVAADLGVATDLSAEDAANALARLANIMDTKGKKAFERLGSTLVDLGNKGASTESEITEMSLRIAGAGETIGLTESQVLGFAAALSNVGIRAEAGGSAISRVMLEIQDAVAQGGKDLAAFAAIAGVSSDAFAKQFAQDAPAAIQLFVEGLDEVKESGGSVVQTLETVELNEIRVRDTLLRLGGATGEVTKAQEIANEAWGKNSALAEEANKRYKTTTSQFEILKNRVFDLGITFGQDLLPQLNKVMKRLGEGDLGGAISAMAELGGRMAARLAGALGKAFLESDILGKLFIGGAIIRVLGGRGAFLALGKTIGKFTGRGMAIGIALAIPLILPDWIDFWRRQGPKIRQIGVDIGEKFVNALIAAVNFGIARINDIIGRIDLPGIDPPEIGEIGKVDFKGPLEEPARKAVKNVKDLFHGLSKSAGQDAKKTGQEWQQWSQGFGVSTGKAASISKRDMRKLSRNIVRGTGRAAGGGAENIEGFVNAVGEGLNTLDENTGKAMKAFSAKWKGYSVKSSKLKKTWSEAGFDFARGGILPGYSRTDDTPAMLRRGEAVLTPEVHQPMVNRALQATYGTDLTGLFRKTGANMPTGAKGGVPHFQTGGLQPGISRLASWVQQELNLSISSGLRPGTGSLHNTGEAIDLVPPSMRATVSIFENWKDQLEELFYDPWGGWDSGQMIGAIGGHMDHIHAAILGAGGGGAKGAVAAAAQLARVILRGPKGSLLDMGQSALDKVRSAGNEFLGQQGGGLSGVSASGPLQAIAQKMIVAKWGQGQWPPFDDLVMRESGWDPTAVNASSGAAGLAQALPPSKYPPGAWPYTGKESAVKQLQWMISYIAGRYGTPSGAIAFHDSHNWYKKGGGIDLPKSLKQIKKGKKNALSDLMGKIGDLAPLPAKKQKEIDALTGKAAVFGDYADTASALGVDDAEGNIIPGMFGGKGESHWVTKQLEQLFALRNKLVNAYNFMLAIEAKIKELVKEAKKQLRRREKDIKGAKKAVAKLKKKLPDLKGKQRTEAQKQIKKLESGVKGETKVIGALKGKIIPGYDTEAEEAGTSRIDLLDLVETAQGLGRPMKPLATLPGIGVLGGDIMAAQTRLRDLGATASIGDSGAANESRELKILLGQQSILRELVSLTQGQVLRSTPYVGAFQTGGVVPETGLAMVHKGETISPAGNPIVEIHFANGMQWLEQFVDVRVNGQTRKAATRAGRSRPGQAGVLR
jgi:TP901 family phage tail tape measure protein